MTDLLSKPRARKRVRRHVPTVLQLEVTECGAASLAMVLGSYGRTVPLEELRIACGVSRDGAKASAIVRAGEHYGLQIKGYRREPEQLREMEFPLIAHWNFAHFLVVEGYHPGGWYLNDPAVGPRDVDDEEFDRSFTGVVLQPHPGPDFTRGGNRAGVMTQLIRAAGSRRGIVLAFAVLGLLLLVPTLIVPQILSGFGQQLAGSPGIELRPAVVGLLFAVLIQAAVLFAQGQLAVRMTSKISVRLGSAMVLRLLRLPIAFHAQRGASMMVQRASVAESLSASIASLTITALTASITALASLAILFGFDVGAALLAAIVGTITMFILRRVTKSTRNEAQRLVRDVMDFGSVVMSSLHQIESVKASGSEQGVIARGTAAQNRLMGSVQRLGASAVAIGTWPLLIGGFGSVVIAAFVTWRIARGDLQPGAFLSIQALAAGVIGPLSVIAVTMDQTQTLAASLDQVDDVLEASEDPVFLRTEDRNVRSRIAGAVELRNVTFGYAAMAEPTIRDFSLSVAPGQRVALVGPSGCGKSTVSRLVTGLYPAWSGEVLLDGLPRSEHAREVLLDSIALVDQQVAIFAASIRDNVTLWDETISDADVLAAIEDAQLGEELARRPGGLDSVLSEGGADLSGGQRQRLEIARALVKNPSILVMDEATSALDPVTELLIDEAIRRRGITAIIIAHRLSTIRDSDEIICMDKGVTVERGTHDELIESGGFYAKLVAST